MDTDDRVANVGVGKKKMKDSISHLMRKPSKAYKVRRVRIEPSAVGGEAMIRRQVM